MSAADVGAMLLREAAGRGDEARPHVVCSALSHARAAGACLAACAVDWHALRPPLLTCWRCCHGWRAGKELARLAGADNVQVTYSSSRKNVACYSARINDEQAGALRQLPVIQCVASQLSCSSFEHP